MPGSHDRIQRTLLVPTPSKFHQLLSSKSDAFGIREGQSGAPPDPTASVRANHRNSGDRRVASSLRAARRLNSPPTLNLLSQPLNFRLAVCSVSQTDSVKPHDRAVFMHSEGAAAKTLQPLHHFRSHMIAKSGADRISENDSQPVPTGVLQRAGLKRYTGRNRWAPKCPAHPIAENAGAAAD